MNLISDTHQRLSVLIYRRLPWLVIGLLGGVVGSFLVSRYESILVENISLAFFLPVIVYMSDAVATQTETIFVRDLAEHRANFLKYLSKELFIGIYLGLILGVLMGLIAKIWLGNTEIALTVGIAMFINVLIAPVLALVMPEILFKERTDPALGAGPITTVIQDIVSLLIYFLVASLILWHKVIF